jgi:hexosaminidase
MRGNCANAAQATIVHGGRGMLITDWGDQGHLQYLPISEPGFAYGAAVAWCHDTNRDLDLAAALNAHAFTDPTGVLGAALLELGDLHRLVTPQWPNQSMLIMHLYSPELPVGRDFTDGMTVPELEAVVATLDSIDRKLEQSRPERADGTLVLDELRNAIYLVRVLAFDAQDRLRGDGSLESIPEARRARLADALGPIIDEHERLWLARNREGGLVDSSRWLRRLLRCYEVGSTDA